MLECTEDDKQIITEIKAEGQENKEKDEEEEESGSENEHDEEYIRYKEMIDPYISDALIAPKWCQEMETEQEKLIRKKKREQFVEGIQGWKMIIKANPPQSIAAQNRQIKMLPIDGKTLKHLTTKSNARNKNSPGQNMSSNMITLTNSNGKSTIQQQHQGRVVTGRAKSIASSSLSSSPSTSHVDLRNLPLQVVQKLAAEGKIFLENGKLTFRDKPPMRRLSLDDVKNIVISSPTTTTRIKKETEPIITKVESIAQKQSTASPKTTTTIVAPPTPLTPPTHNHNTRRARRIVAALEATSSSTTNSDPNTNANTDSSNVIRPQNSRRTLSTEIKQEKPKEIIGVKKRTSLPSASTSPARKQAVNKTPGIRNSPKTASTNRIIAKSSGSTSPTNTITINRIQKPLVSYPAAIKKVQVKPNPAAAHSSPVTSNPIVTEEEEEEEDEDEEEREFNKVWGGIPIDQISPEHRVEKLHKQQQQDSSTASSSDHAAESQIQIEMGFDEPQFISMADCTRIVLEQPPAKKKKFVHEPQLNTDGKLYKKPNFSYSCLIGLALKNSESGILPVSEIYKFICDHWPYYRFAPGGWKNAVRHNLSKNPYFEKIDNSDLGTRKGCLWALNAVKVHCVDAEVSKWLSRDPIEIPKSMSDPENLDLILRGEMKKDYSEGEGNINQSISDDDDDFEFNGIPLSQLIEQEGSRDNLVQSVPNVPSSSSSSNETNAALVLSSPGRPQDQKINIKSSLIDAMDFIEIKKIKEDYRADTGSSCGTYILSRSPLTTSSGRIRKTPAKLQ